MDPPDPCDEVAFPTASATFGTLDPYFYEDVVPGAPDQQCQNPGSNSIDYTIAEGIDHLLGAYDPDYSPGDPELVEGNGCPGNPPQLFPNTMATQTGYSAQRLADGLLHGGTFDGGGFTGRLTKTPNPLGSTFAGEPMDNTPLWSYIRGDVNTANVPVECRNTFNGIALPVLWDYYDLKAEMIRCIQQHTPAHDPVFTEDILLNGRFAFIPLVAEGSIPMGVVHFNEFVPIYINKLYQEGIQAGFSAPQCWEQDVSVPGNSGWHTHEAGQPFNCGRPNQNVDRVASIVLECRMLPDTICVDNNPSTPGGDPVLVIELTK